MRRRRFLRESTLSTLTGASIASSSCVSWADTQRQNDDGSDNGFTRSDFLWLHGRLLKDTKIRENLLAFASRHDLAVILRVGMPSEDRSAADILREPLETARTFGVTTWLAAGVLEHTTAEAFVEDAEARRTHERRLAELVSLYDELSEGGRVILWEEAPIAGRWTADGKWSEAAIRNLRDHGAEIFATQRGVVKDVDPDLEAGIFVHFTYIVDSKTPKMYATLMDELREREALPDFSFTDFYRGNYEKDIGPTRTNRTVRSLVTNAREHTDGREVFYMASPHTINPRYTVSQQSIRMDIRAARDVVVDGLGWYTTSRYRRTEQGFDAYVPNTALKDAIEGDSLGTFTVARDRFLYAYAATLGTRSGYGSTSKFDLWLKGSDFGFHDHRLEARTADGNWTFLGDLAGYRDGDYDYSTTEGDHVAILHALDRETLLGGDGIELRVRTDAESHGAALTGAWLVPFDPAYYVTEHEATRIVDDRDPGTSAFGEWSGPVALNSGTETRVSIPATSSSPGGSLATLAYPGLESVARRLRDRESDDRFDPSDTFDLWVLGSNLAGADGPAFDLEVDADSGVHSIAQDSVAAAAIDDAVVFYGLDRDPFLEVIDEATVDIRSVDDSTSVRFMYAMPYFGSGNVKGPREVRRLLEGDPEGARIFSDTWQEYDQG